MCSAQQLAPLSARSRFCSDPDRIGPHQAHMGRQECLAESIKCPNPCRPSCTSTCPLPSCALFTCWPLQKLQISLQEYGRECGLERLDVVQATTPPRPWTDVLQREAFKKPNYCGACWRSLTCLVCLSIVKTLKS